MTPMADESTYIALARLAHDAFHARRRYEWRINFSLWGGLAAIGYWAVNVQKRIFDTRPAAYGVGVALLLLYLGSLLLINYGHRQDKEWKRYYMRLAVKKESPEPTQYCLSLTQVLWCLCQTGFTALLIWLVLEVLLGVHPPLTR